MADVSVVVVTYNALPWIEKCLESVDGCDVIVVDNGSTDGTAEIARRLPVRVVREDRRGYGSACLAGVEALEHRPPDVLVFLDGDFSDHPEELKNILAMRTPTEIQVEMRILAKSLGVATAGTAPRAEVSKARPLVRPVTGSPHTADTDDINDDLSFE